MTEAYAEYYPHIPQLLRRGETAAQKCSGAENNGRTAVPGGKPPCSFFQYEFYTVNENLPPSMISRP